MRTDNRRSGFWFWAAPTRAPNGGVSPARRRVARGGQHGDETVSEGLNADDRRTALSIPDDAGAAPAMGRERATPQPPGLGAAPRAARASDRNHRPEAAGRGAGGRRGASPPMATEVDPLLRLYCTPYRVKSPTMFASIALAAAMSASPPVVSPFLSLASPRP